MLSVELHSVVLTPRGGRTEDFKINHTIDFDEVSDTSVEFEQSSFYASFAASQFLIMRYQETEEASLADARYLGFKRIVIPDDMLEGAVRRCWDRMRHLIISGELEDVVELDSSGCPRARRHARGGGQEVLGQDAPPLHLRRARGRRLTRLERMPAREPEERDNQDRAVPAERLDPRGQVGRGDGEGRPALRFDLVLKVTYTLYRHI